jgi:hypothetical protein
LLDRFVDIEPQKSFEINKDQGGWGVSCMLPLLKMVQSRGKKLIVRGKLDLADLELLRKELSPRGLYLQIVIDKPEEAKRFQDFFRPWG